MILYISTTLACLLAFFNIAGPQFYAARNVSPEKYHKLISKLRTSFLIYVGILFTFFFISYRFATPGSMSVIATSLGVMLALFPAFTSSFYRLYSCDFKMFKATEIHAPYINLNLNIEEYGVRAKRILGLYNRILFISTAVSLTIYLAFVFNAPNSPAVFFVIIPPVLGMVFLILTIRLMTLPQKTTPNELQLKLLKEESSEIAAKMGIPVPKLFLHPGLATVPYNCLAMPKGMYVSSLLIRDFSAEERGYVIAHELAHYKFKHIVQRQYLKFAFIAGWFVITLAILIRPNLNTIGIALSIGLIVMFALAFITRKLYVKQEYEADAEAMRVTQNPRALKTCLYKITANSLFPQLAEFDNPTHPSNSKRYDAACKLLEISLEP